MRADIHDGQEPNELQAKAGYIDARPLTASSTKTSCDARPDHTLGQTEKISRHQNTAALASTADALTGDSHRRDVPILLQKSLAGVSER